MHFICWDSAEHQFFCRRCLQQRQNIDFHNTSKCLSFLFTFLPWSTSFLKYSFLEDLQTSPWMKETENTTVPARVLSSSCSHSAEMNTKHNFFMCRNLYTIGVSHPSYHNTSPETPNVSRMSYAVNIGKKTLYIEHYGAMSPHILGLVANSCLSTPFCIFSDKTQPDSALQATILQQRLSSCRDPTAACRPYSWVLKQWTITISFTSAVSS